MKEAGGAAGAQVDAVRRWRIGEKGTHILSILTRLSFLFGESNSIEHFL